MASPLLMLRALAMGAQGLALVHSGEMYRSGAEGEPWRGHIGFVQELLDLWGIGGHRVKLFEMGKDAGDIVQLELGRFVDKIAGLPPTSFASTGDVTPGVEGQQLHELIKWMAGRLPQPAEGRVTSGMVSFGMVKLDGDKCTGCGLCALNCPTDAITVITDSGSDGYSISFKYDLCVGCGVCVNTCPEGCVELDKVLALSELGASPTVLFEDSFIKCHRCGGYVAPRSMMERLKARLQSMGNGEMGWTELCPDCRLSVQLQRWWWEMDAFLRVIAVIIEVVILGAVFYFMIGGVRLILFDLGVRKQYSKAITVLLIAVGCLVTVFLISHLSTFYPSI
jgi:Pyruvate/2-oxoacid:ferredoxin oxidoreductase delta subunit